ncbi:hypothetical protein DFH09DRAFT_1446261 [Mycena vulgaris]|nr:hypothetical protein DFH09DRAFT_1446261 [Mycena vulgaris]
MDRLARFAARHGQYMRAHAHHTRASACPHLAPAEYEDLAPPRAALRSPSYLYPRASRARRTPREREESVLPPRSAGFGRAQSVPRRPLTATPAPHSSSSHRRRPAHQCPAFARSPHPREHRDLAHPRARDTSLPRWPRTRTPERRARASLSTSPAASPRVRGLGVSPRALGAALLLALAPRTPRARRPPREREGSVQRPVALASFALSPRSPSYLHPIRAPRSPNPREYVSPRAHLHGICRLPTPRTPPSPHPREYGDTMPPRARSPHRPRRTAPRTCTPVRAQGVAAALSSSHLHRPSARARGADFVPDSPPAIPRARAGVVRARCRCTEMTRAASLREYALVQRRARNAAQCRRPRPRAFPSGLQHPRLGRRRGGERGVKMTALRAWGKAASAQASSDGEGCRRSMVSGRED